MSKIDARKTVVIDYVNHRGERRQRRIQPEYLWWGVTAWHPTEGWLLHAFDFDKGQWRDFAWSGIVGPGEDPRTALVMTTPISDPQEEAARDARAHRHLRALEFFDHLMREGHAQLAQDMIQMGVLESPPSRHG